MKIHTLSPAYRAELRARFAGVACPQLDYQGALVGLYKAFGALPDELLREISLFSRDPGSPGVMLLEGLPIDEPLPATPSHDGEPARTIATQAEKSLLGLAQLMGTPVGYLSEKDGHMVHHVVPMRGGEYTQSNRGSKVFLSYHNDSMYDESMVFNSHNPDYLLLLCLRADRDGVAKTMYADARHIAAALGQHTCDILRQPRFRTAAPSNYTLLIRSAREGEKIWSHAVPVLSGPSKFPEIYLAANGVEALDHEAQQALQALLETCQSIGEACAVHLKPGQAMLINNRKGVHARTEFQAHYDGQDRWLLRANIRTSLWSIRDRATEQSLVFA